MNARLVAATCATLFALVLPALTATADEHEEEGNAAIVVDHGDGNVGQHCLDVGDGISGDEALDRAGYSVEDFSGLVCAIGGTGCHDADGMTSCLCECPTGGEDCTYWAFFTRDADSSAWQYSARGYTMQELEPRTLHGWRWGEGQSGHAEPPPDVTVNDVCAASSDASAESGETPAPFTTVPAGETPTPTGAPVNDAGDSSDGMSTASLAAFGATATALVLAIGGGLLWRKRHGG